MISPPLESTHGERCRAWQDITALGLYALCDDIGSCMTSLPFDSTHGRQLRAWHDITALGKHARSATSDVASHHRPWLAHTIERRQPWHKMTALGQHILSNDVGRGMPSSPLSITHDRTASGVTWHHRLWTAHTFRLCGAWHDINAFGQHTPSYDVGRGMPSSP